MNEVETKTRAAAQEKMGKESHRSPERMGPMKSEVLIVSCHRLKEEGNPYEIVFQ